MTVELMIQSPLSRTMTVHVIYIDVHLVKFALGIDLSARDGFKGDTMLTSKPLLICEYVQCSATEQ